MKTLSVEQVEGITAKHFIVRATTGTDAFPIFALALTVVLFFGGALSGFFGTHAPVPANDAIWQRELWSFWNRHKNLFQDPRLICLANSVLFYVFYRFAKKRFSNWILRGGSDGVYVKYRSYLHEKVKDDGVFFFPRHEIERIQAEIRKGWHAVFDHESTRHFRVEGQKKTFLKISLTEDVDIELLRRTLLAALPRVAGTKKSGPREVSVHWQFSHAPVSLSDSGELRLEIDCSEQKLKSILQVLAAWLDVSPIARIREESIHSMNEEMIWEKVEQSIREGDEISARLLLKSKLGLDEEKIRQLFLQYRATGTLQAVRQTQTQECSKDA